MVLGQAESECEGVYEDFASCINGYVWKERIECLMLDLNLFRRMIRAVMTSLHELYATFDHKSRLTNVRDEWNVNVKNGC